MTNATELLRAQHKKLEALEREKQNLNLSLCSHKDHDAPGCRRIKERLMFVNHSIEEAYSQLSLLRIRRLMGF